MTFWWWLEPLWYTGFVGLLLAGAICLLTGDYYNKVLEVICIVLVVPFALSVLSTVIWVLCFVFWFIWHPYF